MPIVLAGLDSALVDAWSAAFDGTPVSIHRGSIFEVSADAIVSPANSFGFMDSGIDQAYSERFGWDLQLRLRRSILDRHHGELLVGRAEIVETGSERPRWMVAAPTMRVPMRLEASSINPYLATRAALLLVQHGLFADGAHSGDAVAHHIETVVFPGMGTGVGRVSPSICARQMRAAYDEVTSGARRLPSSWAEASEVHQLLYTDKPKRLQ